MPGESLTGEYRPQGMRDGGLTGDIEIFAVFVESGPCEVSGANFCAAAAHHIFRVVEPVTARKAGRRRAHLCPSRPEASDFAPRSATVGASIDHDADADPAANILGDGLDNAPISGEVGIDIQRAARLLDKRDYGAGTGLWFRIYCHECFFRFF